jgi:hypothetical protein
MAEPWPAITFRVNLETLNRYSSSLPYNTQLQGNETVTEADNMKFTRSTWLTSLLSGTEHVFHKEDETVTVYGQKAQYLKNLYATGLPDAVLEVV